MTRELADQLLSAVGQAVVATSLDGTVRYWSRAAERLYGWSAQEAQGRSILQLIVPILPIDDTGMAERVDAMLARILDGRRVVAELEVRARDGRQMWTHVVNGPVYDAEGRVTGVVGISYDISRRRETEEELRRSETRFRALVQGSSDVAVIVAIEGELRYVSPAVESLLGWAPEDLVGTDGWALVHPDDLPGLQRELGVVSREPGMQATAEFRIRCADGSYRWVEETVTNMADDPVIEGLVANIRDVTDRKRAELDLHHRVFHDPLTGLPNRARLDQVLSDALQTGAGAAVLVFDIDQFKLVNDSHGHAAGDDLLSQVSDRIRGALRPEDFAGRFGGDEFVVVCPDVTESALAMSIADRLQEALGSPFQLPGVGPVFVTASVGIATGPAGLDPSTLFQQADAAMYQAKRSGRARSALFDDEMRDMATVRLQTETDLRIGLGRGEIEPYFQPIVDLGTGRVLGVEALARWNHPTRGVLGPAAFVDVAEDNGMIVELGAQVLDRSVEELAGWLAVRPDLSVAVNLSATQLSSPRLLDVVGGVLDRHGVAGERLVLEVTETAVMSDPARCIEMLRSLAAMGIQLALDDFGTGYSSLAYLKELPVQIVKVDRTFIDGVDSRADDRSIVAAVVQLAAAFGRQVVAEGVETEAQRRALVELGCPFAQGYLWSRPVPAAQVRAVL
ncbi:MAG: putative bifunctional diguanylate cyclase/phosphodiesterase [Acidimicrobiales bacterium]